MATQRTIPSRLPLRPLTSAPKPSLVISSDKKLEVATAVLEIAKEIELDGRSKGGKRPYHKAPWLQQYQILFQPGVSGNPAGRPKGGRKSPRKFREAIEKIGDLVAVEGTEITFNDLVALAQYHNAIEERNVFSAREIREVLDGKNISELTAGETADALASSVKQKLMNKLIKVETTSDGKTTVTVAEQTIVSARQFLPIRPLTIDGTV